jgi:hypothetical protein
MSTMQGNPYTAAIYGALRYLAESGLWPYFIGFVLMVALGCWLVRHPGKEYQFWD